MIATHRAAIAIVDDDETVRESLCDLLEFHGYRISTFESADALLNSHAIEDIECLLLDISMPGMSGVDLYQELARRAFVIPAVFMTGHAHDVLINEAAGLGACLSKPFTDFELRTALEAALSRQ